MFAKIDKRDFKTENACIYRRRTIDAYGTFKDVDFCSEKCRNKYKTDEMKKRWKRKRDEVQPAPVFDLMYA